jgi:hypothetical protein
MEGARLNLFREDRALGSQVVIGVIPLALFDCAQSVGIAGVYFPGWLISLVVGVAASYATVSWLGRVPRYRALAQSGLLFLSLTTIVAFVLWWSLFSSVDA